MKRSWILAALLIIVFVIGRHVWEFNLRQYGYDDFDQAFWEAFDAGHIIDNMDKLRKSKQFDHTAYAKGESIYSDILNWPAGNSGESPQVISVKKYTERHEDSSYYHISWDKKTSSPILPTDMDAYKYYYQFHISTPDGEITYMQYGNSRKECKDKMRANLLWLMSLC